MWRVYIILYISCLSSPFSLFWLATLILFLAVRTHWTTVLVNIFIKYLPQESWWRYSITKCCQQVLWNSLLLWIIVKMTVALFTNLRWVCQRIVTLSVNAIIIQNLFSVVFTVFSSFTSVIVFLFFSLSLLPHTRQSLFTFIRWLSKVWTPIVIFHTFYFCKMLSIKQLK